MKRRNADTGKLRRPLKRTKITEGMYGNSMLYLKFVMVWASLVLADYMLEFRFEFLWPFWMMLRSVYDSYKYQGLAFSVFFICIALTSDMICFFFIPIQYIFFAASTYVWVQYVWYTFAEKGICLPTVALCCVVVYVEGARGAGAGVGAGAGAWGGRGLAAHCVGFPAVTLGVGVKAYVGRRLRAAAQRQVRAHNDFYFQLLRDALPQSAVSEVRERRKAQQNGHATREHTSDTLQAKLEHIDQNLDKKQRDREKCQNHVSSNASVGNGTGHHGNHVTSDASCKGVANGASNTHAHTNGVASGAGAPEDEHHCKSSGKSSKYDKKEANHTVKEEKKKNKNKDKDKDTSDSHKSTEHNKDKEQIVRDKEVESTKECVKVKEVSSSKEREREEERKKEKESREREREREKEQEKEREKESRNNAEELKRVRAELANARSCLSGARAELAALRADLAERQRREHRHTHNKSCNWSRERATLERRLAEERRARAAAEQMLRNKPENGTCGGGAWCVSEGVREEAARAREAGAALQRDLGAALQRERAAAERATALERALSAETRVKLDLLAALGDANRRMHIQEDVISRQEKELEELKAQMVAVMPAELVGVAPRALDPNACAYTPRQQLCSDA